VNYDHEAKSEKYRHHWRVQWYWPRNSPAAGPQRMARVRRYRVAATEWHHRWLGDSTETKNNQVTSTRLQPVY